MAKQIQQTKAAVAKPGSKGARLVKKSVIWNFPLSKKNWIIFLIALGAIILGYILLATGNGEEPALVSAKWNNPFAVTIAPIILVIGYCVLVPYSIMKFFGKKSEENN